VDLGELLQTLSSGRPIAAMEAPPRKNEKVKPALSSLPQTWEGFMTYIKDHDSPMYAVLSKAAASLDNGEIILKSASSFLSGQIGKMLPNIKKRTAAFFQEALKIRIEEIPESANGENGTQKKRPSELRTEAMQSPFVKEVIAEFGGTITNVKAKE
jgi:hypothetical protein